MGFSQGYGENVAKFLNVNIQWKVSLDVLASRVVHDTVLPRGDKLIAN
jgi:hypothetical protein